ncbi:MAG: hypothetical protein HY744_30845 [Deltaproteobacteria bacterium]|nr:hypothetical protein [Deltaproteobacteria bacterium]
MSQHRAYPPAVYGPLLALLLLAPRAAVAAYSVHAKAPGTTPANTLAVGFAHSCMVEPNGDLWCWGNNSAGELGDGTTIDRHSPHESGPSLTQVLSVSVGGGHTCAIRRDGSLWCWGDNCDGELGLGHNKCPAHLDPPISTPQQVFPSSTPVRAVSLGFSHTCAIMHTGKAMCWGWNVTDQLGIGPKPEQWTPTAVLSEETWLDISAGFLHTCAVRWDGTAWCWGLGLHGRLGDGKTVFHTANEPLEANGVARAISISAGGAHTCAILRPGGVWCWGNAGLLGDGSNVESGLPVPVSLASAATGINAAGDSTCARLANGDIYCWGENWYGQLGVGNFFDSLVPVKGDLESLAHAAQVARGGTANHHCISAGGGDVACWGYGGDAHGSPQNRVEELVGNRSISHG